VWRSFRDNTTFVRSQMNTVREIERINEEELRRGVTEAQSWHAEYKGSAWIYAGGLDTRLTEGDVLCVFSQWGEVEDFHLVRDDDTGTSKGFAFLKYEDWRSTVLAVDNFNGAVLVGRTLRVDHKLSYSPPKPKGGSDAPAADGALSHAPGHAYVDKPLANEYDLHHGVDLFAPAARLGRSAGERAPAALLQPPVQATAHVAASLSARARSTTGGVLRREPATSASEHRPLPVSSGGTGLDTDASINPSTHGDGLAYGHRHRHHSHRLEDRRQRRHHREDRRHHRRSASAQQGTASPLHEVKAAPVGSTTARDQREAPMRGVGSRGRSRSCSRSRERRGKRRGEGAGELHLGGWGVARALATGGAEAAAASATVAEVAAQENSRTHRHADGGSALPPPLSWRGRLNPVADASALRSTSH
jgi:RNA-binding motif X-linked protein 2